MFHSIVLEYSLKNTKENRLLKEMADFSLLARTLSLQTEPKKEATPIGSQLDALNDSSIVTFYTQQQSKTSLKKRYQVSKNPLIKYSKCTPYSSSFIPNTLFFNSFPPNSFTILFII